MGRGGGEGDLSWEVQKDLSEEVTLSSDLHWGSQPCGYLEENIQVAGKASANAQRQGCACPDF